LDNHSNEPSKIKVGPIAKPKTILIGKT